MTREDLKTIYANISQDWENFTKDCYYIGNLKISEYLKKFLIIFLKFYVVPIYIANKVFNTFKMEKDFIPQNIKKVKISPTLQVDYLPTIENLNIDDKLQSSVNSFMQSATANFSEKQLAFFYKNIVGVDTTSKKFQQSALEDGITLATYDIIKNKLTFGEDTQECTVFHELLHLSSSYYDAETRTGYSGFHQLKRGILNIGTGINEGYTELLTERLSGQKSYCYIYQTHVAQIIEEIVGRDKMQEYYLSANLLGLINELKQYESEENIMQFIQSLDFYTSYSYSTTLLYKKEEKVESSKAFIDSFLNKIREAKILAIKEELKLFNSTKEAGFINTMSKAEYINRQLQQIQKNRELTSSDSLQQFIDKKNMAFDRLHYEPQYIDNVFNNEYIEENAGITRR